MSEGGVMLTNEQVIFAVRSIYPQITEFDHGKKYWVARPVEGSTPLADAFIVQWDFEDLPQPSEEEIAAKWSDPKVQAAFEEANKPAPRTVFSVREFRARFTQDEQIAIRSASLTDMKVGIVYDDFQSAQFIDVHDPAVAQGIDLYVTKGLLAPGRKAELLKPEPIPEDPSTDV